MAAPWEQYQSKETGPWSSYQKENPIAEPNVKDELTWENVKKGAANILPSALLGAAKPFYGLNQAAWQLAGKAFPSVANMGDYPVEMLNKRQAQLNAEAGPVVSKFTTEPAALIGENILPMQAMTKIGAIPSFTKNAAIGGALGFATPEKTGLTPEQFAEEKAKTVGAGAALNVLPETLVTGGKALGSLLRKGAGISTGAGEEALKQAYQSGKAGNQEFLANMRNEVPMENVLNQAKDALASMRSQRMGAYQEGIASIKPNQEIIAGQPLPKPAKQLDFSPIEDRLKEVVDSMKIATPTGEKLKIGSDEARKIKELENIVQEWKSDKTFHTAEGLDALKQRLDALYPESPMQRQAQRAITSVRNAVKDTIVSQDKSYASTMKNYEEALGLEREIEKSLSLGKGKSQEAALKKLQSLTRNNVNTDYGFRQQLANELMKQSGTDLMPAISGQALNSWTPRGLVGQGADVGAIIGALANPASALSFAPMAAYTSPRLMGETAYKAGQIAAKTPKMTDEQKQLARLLLLRSAQGNENE